MTFHFDVNPFWIKFEDAFHLASTPAVATCKDIDLEK